LGEFCRAYPLNMPHGKKAVPDGLNSAVFAAEARWVGDADG